MVKNKSPKICFRIYELRNFSVKIPELLMYFRSKNKLIIRLKIF